MDNQTGVQLGAGVLVLVLLREIFSFITHFWKRDDDDSHTSNNGDSGHKSPEYWRSEMRTASRDVVEMMVLPILDKQTEILSRMNDKIIEIAVRQQQRRND